VELSGRTELLSLFDVTQVLSVNEATGMLRVEQGSEKGYLYFDGGSIINALDAEHREGEEAAKNVFAMRKAHFAFTADLPSVARRISCTTQSLMMEIARALDEESQETGEGEGSHVEEARQATEALYEIFHRLDSESKVLSHRSPQGLAVADLLGAIRGVPGSTLFLRAGAPPEVLAGGKTIPLGPLVLDRAGYESLRDHLLREAVGGVEVIEGNVDFVLRLSVDEAWRLATFRTDGAEVLAIRAAATAAEPLPWDIAAVERATEAPGSIVALSAPDPDTLERAVHTLAAHLLTTGAVPLLGWARRWPPHLAGGRAAVLLLRAGGDAERAAAAELSDRLSPRIVLAADADLPGSLPLVLRAARRGSRGIVGVCSPAADRAPSRLLDGIEPHERALAGLELSARLVATFATASVDSPARILDVDDGTRRALREQAPAPRR
jgi:hypothetical protein